ncbi:hypothetical protein B0T26DRAFT_873737 [Lasiosphaeria miniovina]|uniref:Heterokaryon incompatibility domain-containing protein n=1 Tax=Lasiosphaeria miniovina TaxID=1954250 RepID=A0AA40AD33_9PEZI|nr:uncharacterized protein B0T26DRAFT_873737 [Lasiosphaeria miniovina]KAK0713648.1 hypothetical protein B0T26DRAFT_873737 [Lasiosphaeria miniovina]
MALRVRERLRYPDRGPPEPRPFTFENPHATKGGNVTDSGGYVCSNCGWPFGTSGGHDLWYAAALDHNVSQAVAAARSGCELYRWIAAKTARYIPAVAERWEAPEVMDAIAAHCRFQVSGLSSMGPDQDGRCVLSFRHVCPGAVSEHLRTSSTVLGELPACAAAGDPASEYVLSRPYGLDVTSQQSMQFARHCFSVCMDRHAWCRTDQIGHLALDREPEEALPREMVSFGDVPTRLIDVGTSASPRLRLVETADDDGALMGTCPRPASWRSPTAGEATSFRYLRVDSLCIHQDDVDGRGNNPYKAREITRMASYYGRARGRHAVRGLRAVRGLVREGGGRVPPGTERRRPRARPRADAPQVQAASHAPIGRVFLVEELDTPPPEPITTRGWTLQKSLLSRRILIFARRKLYWSCLNSFGGCGGSITALTNHTIPGVQSLVDAIYPAGSLIEQPTWGQWASSWPATPGARSDARATSSHGGHEQGARREPAYAAGLLADQAEPGTWLAQLLWHPVTPDARRPGTARAPSWSWASVNGSVAGAVVGAAAGRGRGIQLDDLYDAGPWGKTEGSGYGWALVLLADCAEDRRMMEADLESKEARSSDPLLVAMLLLTTGELVGVQGILVGRMRVVPQAGGTSGGWYLRRVV